jgi:tungstate transport system substrate-binding protein
MGRWSGVVGGILPALLVCSGCVSPAGPKVPVRAVVIGGVVETGLWQALTERFTRETGWPVEVVASGPKSPITRAFIDMQADLVTMHSSDAIINLVADGYAVDPQPWLKNDLMIVGPPSDPAGIRGMTDAGEALSRIAQRGAPFVVHASLGAQEVLRSVLYAAGVDLDERHTTVLLSDRAREVLQIAAERQAYTLVGRIPFLSGKMPNAGLEIMVRGDPRLRRPYVVVVANQARFPSANTPGAAALARYLRAERTQAWIAEFGRGQLDDYPVFFRVAP